MYEKDDKKKNSKTLKEFSYGCIMSIALCFMLFLYAPLEIFFSNKNEFWFDVYKLFPVMFVTFIILTAVCVGVLAVCYIIARRLYQGMLVVGFVVFISSYVQGNFFISNLPPLDGTVVDWSQYTKDTVESFILWIVVTLFVIGLIKYIHIEKFYKVVSIVCTCMTLVLFITLISICLSNEGYKKKTNLSVTNENKFVMSTDTNFIILLLDAVDARNMTELFEMRPEYKKIFSDFTYYPNLVGSYPWTQCSVPFILSGDWYENEEPFEEYNVNAYKNSPLFSKLESMNYKIGMYANDIPLYDEVVCRFENIKNDSGKFQSLSTLSILEIKLAGIKYAPYSIKKYCLFDMNRLNDLKVENDFSLFNSSDVGFYNELNSIGITYTEDKSFKFIHLEGAHVPFQLDKDMNRIEDASGTYEEKIEACMTLTDLYFQKLMDAGVYDNSVIIVMADHGFAGEHGDRDKDTIGRHNPIFMAKGINEKHDMYISQAPISQVDLQEAFSRLMSGSDSTEIFDWKEGDERERRYLFHYYLEDNHLIEYLQTGDVNNMETMLRTGKEFYREK